MKDEDRESCPFILPNSEPMTWQWLNTVNRVNTQVKKVSALVLSSVFDDLRVEASHC